MARRVPALFLETGMRTETIGDFPMTAEIGGYRASPAVNDAYGMVGGIS